MGLKWIATGDDLRPYRYMAEAYSLADGWVAEVMFFNEHYHATLRFRDQLVVSPGPPFDLPGQAKHLAEHLYAEHSKFMDRLYILSEDARRRL